MPKYRLDEYKFLRHGISLNKEIWIEEIEFQEDGEIFYTEKYSQIKLIDLLKLLH